jgi:hypothetical protein
MVGLVAGAVKGRDALPWYLRADQPCAAPVMPAEATLAQTEKDAFDAD